MRSANIALRHVRTRRGFNLIEAAIVLGVVGLVIGGIWVAASAMREKWMIKEIVSQTNSMADAYSKLIPLQASQGLADNSELNTFAILSGISPPSWKYGTTSIGWAFTNEFGHITRLWHLGNICSFRAWASAYVCVRAFGVYILDLPRSVCINLLIGFSKTQGLNGAAGPNNRIYTIEINSSSSIENFPVSLSSAGAACNQSGSSNQIRIDYPYRQSY